MHFASGANKRLATPPGFLSRFNSPAKSPLFLLVLQPRRIKSSAPIGGKPRNRSSPTPWNLISSLKTLCHARKRASWLHLSTIPFDVSAILSTDLFPPIDRSFLFEKRPHFPSLCHSSPYFSLSRVRRNFVTEIKIPITRGTRGSKFREVFRSRSA